MTDFVRTYADGTPYRPPRSRRVPDYAAGPLPVAWLRSAGLDWPTAWQRLSSELTRRGYQDSSLRAHRQILRRFREFLAGRPLADVHAADVTRFLYQQTAAQASWCRKGMIISVLRTFFDKLGGMAILCNRTTPKRPLRLPEALSREQVGALVAAAATPRDQLLLSLMYGCGLKRGELQALQWRHFTADGSALNAPGDGTLLPRLLPVPEAVQPLIRLGVTRCPADASVFPGRRDKPLGGRAIADILRAAGRAAGIAIPVTGMTLRHSFALHSLADGMNLPTLQLALGHRHIKSTLIYQRLLRPDVVSPYDRLPGDGLDPASRVSSPPAQAAGDALPPLDPALVTLPFPPPPSLLDDVRRVYAGFKQALRSRFARPPPGG